MRNDWRNILGKKIELTEDIQFDIQLENFFENFIYVDTDSNDNVIVRCAENNKDYILKYNSTHLFLEYIVNECEYKKKVRKCLSYTVSEEVNKNNSSLVLNKVVTRFKEDVKTYYKDFDVIEKESRFNVTETVLLFEIDKNNIKDFMKEEFAASTLKKICMPLDIKSKYVIPDIHVASEVYRDDKGTKICPYIQKGSACCFSEPYNGDNKLPTIELATRSAKDIFDQQDKLFARKNYVKYKRKKIGFI